MIVSKYCFDGTVNSCFSFYNLPLLRLELKLECDHLLAQLGHGLGEQLTQTGKAAIAAHHLRHGVMHNQSFGEQPMQERDIDFCLTHLSW